MGFCLFEHADVPGGFFAVNSAHVDDVMPQVGSRGYSVSHIKLPVQTGDFNAYAAGDPKQVRKIIMEATKIGLQKVEADIVGSQTNFRASPLLLNNPGRVVLVRELLAEEIAERGAALLAMSEMYMEDGKLRLIAQRAGIFAYKANAGSRVPILKTEDLKKEA